MDVEYRARCNDRVFNKYFCANFKSVVFQCKENLGEDAGSNQKLGDTGALLEQNFWVFSKTIVTEAYGDKVIGNHRCR